MVSRAVKLRDGAALEKSELLPSADCGSPGRRGPGKSVHCSDSPSLIHTPPVETPKSDRPEIHTDAFLHRMMRRQLHLSIACAATFLLALLGLPLLNYFLPELMATRVLGFTLTWLILGVLFFPLVWVIAWVFVRKSIALEDAEIKEVSDREDGEKVGRRTENDK
jgi:uncharacterized membrane protein (DUF485 family)